MIIDNIGWNVEAVKAMDKKTFVNDPQHHGLYWRIPDIKERRKALSAAYDLITGKQGEVKPVTKEQE